MDIIQTLAQELDKAPQHVENVVRLLDEGNTIPFIARYLAPNAGGAAPIPPGTGGTPGGREALH